MPTLFYVKDGTGYFTQWLAVDEPTEGAEGVAAAYREVLT